MPVNSSTSPILLPYSVRAIFLSLTHYALLAFLTDALTRRTRRPPMLDPIKKKKIIEKFKTHATDTGSPQVQIAILSSEIEELIEHLKTHKKDHSSRRGLVKKVSERRRLMKYMKREDQKAYDDLMSKLKI